MHSSGFYGEHIYGQHALPAKAQVRESSCRDLPPNASQISSPQMHLLVNRAVVRYRERQVLLRVHSHRHESMVRWAIETSPRCASPAADGPGMSGTQNCGSRDIELQS